ncbi:hypothetical protein QSJ19_08675 [Gordonia sp. ABSL11-1]|uniref:hypothetical protein n=1 Tax=Gordonia sp. ABSL11-1 TaxID=3053924 RepID=UPI002573E86F|nr:hypothetical protein [Gordonia sp. ABSL11-1]MDL9945658.1 hypothetical protein [Gordonia sp. ABSL11-1]
MATATLLSSDELEIRVIFTDPVTDVIGYVRDVVRDRAPMVLSTGKDTTAYVVLLANVREFTLAEDDTDSSHVADDDPVTVVTSIAELDG